MDEMMMQGGGMQGEGGGMVTCPCCGQGQVPPEVAEKVTQALEPQPDEAEGDTASKLAEAMSGPKGPPMPMRRG